MGKELLRIELEEEMNEAVKTIEAALLDSGYTGFFDITGGNAHIDCFYFNGELHTQDDENQWFLRKDVM